MEETNSSAQLKTLVKEKTKNFFKLPLTRQELVVKYAKEYAKLSQQEKLFKARRDKIYRPVIEEAVDEFGIEDSEGHKHLTPSDDVEIIRQKKVSRALNPLVAREILEKRGIYDYCVTQVISYEIDEDKIYEAYEAGKITAAELDRMFTENVSYATIVNTTDDEIQSLAQLRKNLQNNADY